MIYGSDEGLLETYLSQVGDDVQHRLSNLRAGPSAIEGELHLTLHATEIARGILDVSYTPTRAALLDAAGLLERAGFEVGLPRAA